MATYDSRVGAELDIKAFRFATFPMNILVTNTSTGAVFDLTNYSFRMQVRKTYDGPPIVSMDISKNPRLEVIKHILNESDHIRELGCSAMSLSYLATGSLDLHLDIRGTLRITDVAAGLLILKEAGGAYAIDGDLFGNISLNRHTKLELVAASSNRLLQEALKIIYGKKA